MNTIVWANLTHPNFKHTMPNDIYELSFESREVFETCKVIATEHGFELTEFNSNEKAYRIETVVSFSCQLKSPAMYRLAGLSCDNASAEYSKEEKEYLNQKDKEEKAVNRNWNNECKRMRSRGNRFPEEAAWEKVNR